MTAAAYHDNTARKQEKAAASVRVVKGGRYSALAKMQHAMRTAGTLFLCALSLGLVVSVIQSKAKITALSGEIENTRSQLTEAQSEYDYLSSRMSAITSRSNISEVAEGDLGLVKADSSQLTYLRLEDESVLVKNTSGAVKLLDHIKMAGLSLIDLLDP